ncbi:MAG: hypothetical protein DRI24_16220 [Deltaproteobacteria bacterium]|nr:MAG: hypothetical protein DRI24_16220 [Deltaproteobacteria bacterium]
MPRGKKAEVRKREIVEQFYQVIVEDGLERASLARIAERLSVSPSLLIHHFKNKDELILQLMDYILGKYAESFSAMIDAIQGSRQRISSILDLIFSREWTKTIDDRVYITCLHLGQQNNKAKRRLQGMYRIYIDMLEKEFEQYADDNPELEIEPEKLVRLIISVQEGLDIFKDLFPDDRNFQDLGSYVKPLILNILKT